MLGRLMEVCRVYGLAYPVECVINTTSYTCYNYGPRGARMRRHIVNEWWKSCSRSTANVHLVENVSSNLTNNTDNVESQDQESGGGFLSVLSDGMLEHYLPTLHQVRSRLPFAVAQIGRAIKLPHPDIEQTDLVQHFYVPPAKSARWMDKLQATRLQWWAKYARTPSNFEIPTDSSDLGTINITYVDQKDPLESIRNHGDQPLSEMQELYGTSFEGLATGLSVLPHVIEVRTTVEQVMAAFLRDGYGEEEKLGIKAQVLRIHPLLTPYYVAIVTEGHAGSPEDLAELTRYLATEIRNMGIAVLDVHDITTDDNTHTHKHDETGVVWTVILSQNTLENGIALMRNRDTTIKERINIADLCKRLMYHLRTA